MDVNCKFKCYDPDFEGLVGDIIKMFPEEGVRYFKVKGSDWEGVFREDEGEVV